ncbi:MAG: cellulase family glycosylhydrolase, partial [Chloroflexota bacterium]
MRRLRRVLLWVLVGAAAVAGYPGALATSLWASATTTPTAHGPAGPLPWLHVEHPAGADIPFIADDQGRRVILRGVVAAGLVDYWTGSDPSALTPLPYFPVDPAAYAGGACPANSSQTWIPPVCRNDLAEMRALGFNVLRLSLSWSLLEPAPGRYDEHYLARIAQVVGWAREEGIYVILDMHQNAYSRYLGRAAPLPGGEKPGLNDYDGAPAWATFPEFLPAE